MSPVGGAEATGADYQDDTAMFAPTSPLVDWEISHHEICGLNAAEVCGEPLTQHPNKRAPTPHVFTVS